MHVLNRTAASRVRAGVVAVALLALLASLLTLPGAEAQAKGRKGAPRAAFTLTLLHNNDGESQLLSAPEQPDFGGVARFATLVDDLRDEALERQRRGARDRGVLMLSSGDNFLAGPEFSVSLENGVPFYDTVAMDLIGYDAAAIGNHEFDFGPDTLADFIDGFINPVPFLSANLDVSAEPRLQTLAEEGRIAPSAIVRTGRERVGVIGATTPDLPLISSPRRVEVLADVAGIVQDQVDFLTRRRGVDKIVLVSHLQDINEERALVPELRGVDVVIGGGGGELLANPGDLLVPGDEEAVAGSYPLVEEDQQGRDVPIVTTTGDYKYVGRLVVDFDRRGRVLRVGDASGPVRVSGVAPDAVQPDPKIQRRVAEPVQAGVDELASNVLADSAVALDGRRSSVRSMETNEGNLVADSQIWQAERLADGFGVPQPDIALQNGGGLRNDSLIPAGPITELDTFDIAPFSNFVAVVPDVPREQVKELLEHGVAAIGGGQFAQVGGLRLVYDPDGTAQVVDAEGNVTTPGTRVRDVTLEDGTEIVSDGQVVAGDPITIATIDFLARGGDGYPFRAADFTTIGISYQQALANYLVEGLAGEITAADYPEGGEGRITTTP